MWDFFSSVVEDITLVCDESEDDELVKYVTLNIPECLTAYFSSKMGMTSVKVTLFSFVNLFDCESITPTAFVFIY